MAFILRGIFLGTRSEIDWFLHGMRAIFPEAWRDFAEHLPANERGDLLSHYYRRLIDRNPDIGAVVVTGGPYFCAGAHRDTLAGAGADPVGEPAPSDLSVVYRSFARVGELEPPTVAAIRGGAVGAGINLAFATDLRVVADDARLMAGFSRIGLHPVARRTAAERAEAKRTEAN